MSLEDIRRERLAKLERYEAAGSDAYPADVRRDFSIGELRKSFAKHEKAKRAVTVVGRLRALREHGGATFADLEDASGKVQLYWSRDELGEAYDALLGSLDIGDFVEASGIPFKTKRGELSLRITKGRIVTKSLLPLPEKWHGLKDVEERFRKRYLDLLMNPEVRERFMLRSAIVSAIREFFDSEAFLEVETPMLQPMAGGALARPFATHHNALDIDLFLRIAPELYLKELLVGGMERVYELGKSFRNEGIDVTHNPEFTTVEWYAAYWNEETMMACVERFFAHILKRAGVKGKLTVEGKTITIPKAFTRITFTEILKRHAQVLDYDAETRNSLAERAQRFGISTHENEPKGKIADEIYKKICRPRIEQPTFITEHPLDISPLAKRLKKGAENVRRFQLVVGGYELVNAYAELNDPRDQANRFNMSLARMSGGEDAHPGNEDFVEALEYGMPPAAGAGLGIDRLVMLLSDTKNIREVVLFPTLRPRS